MAKGDPRPFTRWDVAIVAASALLGGAMAWATDREYLGSHGASPARRIGETRRLPGWLGNRRHDAIRICHGGGALFAGLSPGVAAATFRPRRGAPARRRLGPGHVASAVSALAIVAIAANWWAEVALFPVRGVATPSAFPGVIPPVHFYSLWQDWRPVISWVVLGAWSTSIATGGFGLPIDVADRLGRWLGWGWLALIAAQGAVYVIAWW